MTVPPRPQHHALGWTTRGLPHFPKRDDNPFARKIRDLPVSRWSSGGKRLESNSKWTRFVHVHVPQMKLAFYT